MAEGKYWPWQFVDYLNKLNPSAGQIQLKQYMSSTLSNGGNDSTHSLFKNLRSIHEGGDKHKPKMNDVVGSHALDLALKGQGSGKTFIDIWNFMCRNKEELKKYTVHAYARRAKGKPNDMVPLRDGKVFDMYFKGKSDKEAIDAMIQDRFFGIDCIGFVGQYLVYTGEWAEYIGTKPDLWMRDHCKLAVNKVQDIKALDFLIFVGQGHIAIIDEVLKTVNGKTIQVDICQSSSGEVIGPQLNRYVELQEGIIDGSGRRQYLISHLGTPRMPVDGHVYIMRRAGFT